MSVVGDLRQALRTNIKGSLPNWQVSPYRIASPTPPGVMIARGEIRPHLNWGQDADYDFRIIAFVGDAGGEKLTQIQLDELLDPFGPTSMIAALESDKTLGGLATDVVVLQPIPEEQILLGADNMARVIAEWTVTVTVEGH